MMCMPAASAAAATPEAAPGARPTPCACSACRRAHAPQQHQRWAHQASHQMQQARGYYAGGEPGMAAGHGYLREYHGTTILCVRKGNKVVLIGDGQVSLGPTIVKPNAKKVRRIGDGVVAGFAGSAADGLSLLERLEMKLEEHPGQLMRAAVELAKQWRQDKALRFLQAELLVADANTTLTVAGNGDVLEPQDGVMAIGALGVGCGVRKVWSVRGERERGTAS